MKLLYNDKFIALWIFQIQTEAVLLILQFQIPKGLKPYF